MAQVANWTDFDGRNMLEVVYHLLGIGCQPSPPVLLGASGQLVGTNTGEIAPSANLFPSDLLEFPDGSSIVAASDNGTASNNKLRTGSGRSGDSANRDASVNTQLKGQPTFGP